MRAEEYDLTYFTLLEVPLPFTLSPLFRIRDEANLSIGFRNAGLEMHLKHAHMRLAYDMYWILENGSRLSGYSASLPLDPIRSPVIQQICTEIIKNHQ